MHSSKGKYKNGYWDGMARIADFCQKTACRKAWFNVSQDIVHDLRTRELSIHDFT